MEMLLRCSGSLVCDRMEGCFAIGCCCGLMEARGSHCLISNPPKKSGISALLVQVTQSLPGYAHFLFCMIGFGEQGTKNVCIEAVKAVF